MNTVQVGPVLVRSVCPVQSRVQATETVIQAPCAVAIENTSHQTQEVATQIVSTRGVSPMMQISTTQTVYPRQVISLPPPPSGQAWLVVVISRADVQGVVHDMGWIALGMLAFAGIGVYATVKDRHNIARKAKSWF